MRIGYSFWGFLADVKLDSNYKEISAPDGNATYGWSIISEMISRGHEVYSMQLDRDQWAFKLLGDKAFSSFAQKERCEAYKSLKKTVIGHYTSYPELDVLLLEWRWPIPGRNCDVDERDPLYQSDLQRQSDLLNHYGDKNTKIIIWDLDHKLTDTDEAWIKPNAIFETSSKPLRLTRDRTIVQPPIKVSCLLEHPTLPQDPNRKLVYIGSRYERDDVITEWIKPVSERFQKQVEFHGNWDKTLAECMSLWPAVSYNGRVTVKDFRKIYGTACGVPLLAKKSYLETGFITPRPWEALLFGSIPVGLSSMLGVEKYVSPLMIAKDAEHLGDISDHLSKMSLKERDDLRKSNIEMLGFMDAKYFVDEIERVK